MCLQSTEEKEDLERQLQHERNARLLQEQINEEQQRFQHSLHEDTSHASVSTPYTPCILHEDTSHASVSTPYTSCTLYMKTPAMPL